MVAIALIYLADVIPTLLSSRSHSEQGRGMTGPQAQNKAEVDREAQK